MKFQKYIAILIGLFQFSFIFSQEEMMKYEVEGKYHVGYIISHRNDVEILVKGYTRIGEINFAKRFNGNEDWQLKYRYPYLGVSFFFFDFSNPENLGNAYAMCGYWEYPITNGEKLQLSFKLGLGPGYVEKVFDPVENYKNYALGTRWNGFAHGNLKARYRFSKAFDASLGISISHFSNASYQKPNLGINIPAVNFGVGYAFNETEKVPVKEKKEYTYDKSWDHDLIVSWGPKEKNPVGGERYNVFSYKYVYSKRFTFKSRFGAGLDIMYNGALEGQPMSNGELISDNQDKMQVGINLGYYFQIQYFTFYFNQGYYLYNQYQEDGDLYHRWGMRYAINDKYIINASMRTHFGVADHVEYGIGYRF